MRIPSFENALFQTNTMSDRNAKRVIGVPEIQNFVGIHQDLRNQLKICDDKNFLSIINSKFHNIPLHI